MHLPVDKCWKNHFVFKKYVEISPLMRGKVIHTEPWIKLYAILKNLWKNIEILKIIISEVC